jgi:hypothetical protein
VTSQLKAGTYIIMNGPSYEQLMSAFFGQDQESKIDLELAGGQSVACVVRYVKAGASPVTERIEGTVENPDGPDQKYSAEYNIAGHNGTITITDES